MKNTSSQAIGNVQNLTNKNSQSFGHNNEEMRYYDSNQKLAPKNLDEKSAGSSSADHLNQIIMPLQRLAMKNQLDGDQELEKITKMGRVFVSPT